MKRHFSSGVCALLAVVALAACPDETPAAADVLQDVANDLAADAGDTAVATQCADFNPLKNPYFGDTHIHTSQSLDAVLQGTRLTPEDAYRFARGEEVGIQPYDAEGNALRKLKLARPLDFVAVSDHSEYLGTVAGCQDPASALYSTADCELFRSDPNTAYIALNFPVSVEPGLVSYPGLCGTDGAICAEAARAPWQLTQQLAEENTDGFPGCGFTAFVAYEWSGAPGTENLHRNVIFRNNTVPELPVSYFDTPYATGLWAALKTQCLDAGNGCDVLAIPHNTNLANGRMFTTAQSYVDAGYTGDDAAFQARMEPLVEIFQHKGDSECDLSYTNPDEACGFEDMPFNNLSNPVLGLEGLPRKSDFVRPALAEGLIIGQQLGANPYEMGIIASTDTHLATPGWVSEKNHPGHGGAGTPARDGLPEGLTDIMAFNPGGLAVVWAEENTRDAIFDAMLRRETYGTSGPRIVLRFFGGWEYPTNLCDAADLVAQGYDGGVPMGGRLGDRPGSATTPTFVVHAMKDPGVDGDAGTDLQRVQVIKGWVEGGEPMTKVFDVAGDANNGASVDETTCAVQGSGAETLCTTWSDPEFDPASPAFYYVRVLENPTCRWSTYQCNAGNVDCSDPGNVPEAYAPCCDPAYPKTIQERAWSSPIWYLPPSP